MIETRVSPRSSKLILTSDGKAWNRAGRELKLQPNTGGYLRASYRREDGTGATANIHVLICEAFHGPKPSPEMHAAHENGNKLDNRADNLRWKTPAENYADRDRHGATARGERQHLARLTDEKVREIRRLLHDGHNSLELSKQFYVSDGTIRAVGHRKTWTHVEDEFPGWVYREGCEDTRGANNGNSRIDEEQVREIRSLCAAGVPQRDIAKKFGISQPLVSTIKRRLTWAHLPD